MDTDCMDAEQSDHLPIIIEGHVFKPDLEGLWSLNEIHRGLALPESKAPSEWNNSVSNELTASGNFRKVDKVGSFADELGTIAYAMWVSTDFYLMVARAFVVMRNDAILSARMASLALVEKERLLTDNMPKADAFMHKAGAIGLSWSEACRAAGIRFPRLAVDYLTLMGKFTRYVSGTLELRERPVPMPKGYQGGYFKRCETSFGNREGFRVTPKGLVWLQGKALKINEATYGMKRRNREAARRRAAK